MKTSANFSRCALRRFLRPMLAAMLTFLASAFAGISSGLAQGGTLPHPPTGFSSDFQPPRDGDYAGAGPVEYANGIIARHVALSRPSTSKPSPAAGTVSEVICDVTFTAEVSANGGGSFAPVSTTARTTLTTYEDPDPNTGGPGRYIAEMVVLEVAGGSLPPAVRVRESPTRPSLGRTTIAAQPDGTFRIDSFFDIFTELSLDGGQTWSPSGPLRVVLGRLPARHFFYTEFQPAAGEYHSAPASPSVSFPNGATLRRFNAIDGKGNQLPPPNNPARVDPFFESVACDLSLDGGQSFTRVSAAPVSQVAIGDVDGDGVYELELLQMDLSGGSLPAGVRVRESPTRASLGRTNIRAVEGGFMIDSFFDVFTELSVDGGQTWTAAPQPQRLELSRSLPENSVATDFFPPRDGRFATPPNALPVLFAKGTLLRRVISSNDFHHNKRLVETPAPGQLIEIPHTLTFEASTDGGQTWLPWTADALATVRVAAGDVTGDGIYETEMLQLDLSGGNLPAGFRIRESPTRASMGGIALETIEIAHEGLKMVSFFDVFTELSLDGGATWHAVDSPLRLELTSGPSPDFFSSNFLPLRADYSSIDNAPEEKESLRFAGDNTPIIKGSALKANDLGARQPPPSAGAPPVTHAFFDVFVADYSTDDGQTFTPVSAPANVRVAVGDVNGDGVYETEILQLDVSGGSLPAGVAIRESPTRASIGRTSISSVEAGFRIDSFFDVFTEISLDGGQTWSPATTPLHFEEQALRDPLIVSDNLLPPVGNYAVAPGGIGVQVNIPPSPPQPLGFSINFTKIEFEYEPQRGERQLPPSTPGGSADDRGIYTYEWDFDYDGVPTHQSGEVELLVRYTLADSTGDAVNLVAEMLSLELLEGGSGSLRIRESPTRPSLGRTSIRALPDGTHRIESFFDVFIELSVDDGQTWHRGDVPLSLRVLPTVNKVTTESESLARAGTVSNAAGERGRAYASGGGVGKVSLQDFHFSVTSPPQPLPASGATAVADLDADGRLDLVLPDGAHVSGECSFGHVVLIGHDFTEPDGTRQFNVEMLSLDVSGGTLPPNVMIRESPTLRSTGRVIAVALPGSNARIGSFFDVFTELSLDGGATWTPSDGPLRLDPATTVSPGALPPPIFVATDFFPPPGIIKIPGKIEYPNLSLTGLEFEPAPDAPRVALPPPGLSAEVTLDGVLSFTATEPRGGVTHIAHPAQLALRITAGPAGPERIFDIEMVGLSLVGAPPGLPAFRIRESLTLPSTGALRLVETQGGFMASSFFDVFTELSLDGGQTWAPADNSGHAELRPQPPLVAVPTNFFPPHDGALGSLRNAPPVVFGFPHMHVRRLRHADFEKNTELVSGITQTLDLAHTALFEFSTDGGQTWQPASAPAVATVRVADGAVTGDGIFEAELLALEISGGSLPAGVRLRESPTRASTGRIKLLFPRLPDPPESDWLRMSAFFDIFTELSLDDGQTWSAAAAPESIALDPGLRRDFYSSNFLPLAADLRKADDDTIDFVGNAAAIGRYVLRAGIPVRREPPPPAGQTRQITVVQEMFAELSLNGGQTFTPFSAPASIHVTVGDLDGDGVLETEMLQMDISGGSLPAGVMLRESPTRHSTGATKIEPVSSGFAIDSFFDVFTEISLDGGGTWSPATDTVRLEYQASPEPIVDDSGRALSTGRIYAIYSTQKGARTIHTSDGLHIEEFELTAVSDGPPLPPPGGSVTFNAEFDLAVRFKQEFGPTQAQRHRCAAVIQVTAEDAASIEVRPIKIEMLALQPTGAPAPILLRESPTRRSLGQAMAQTETSNDDARIGSFFDIFIELSVDGGQTWQPADAPLRAALLPAIQKIRSASRTMPRTGTISDSAGDRGLAHVAVGGGGGGSGKVSMNDFHFVMRSPAGVLPEVGDEVLVSFNGDARLDLVLPDGSGASGVGTMNGRWRGTHTHGDNVRVFETEVLQLEISGGSLPVNIRLRESPTLQSIGRIVAETLPDGSFRIDSFFDIFTEISFDSGATWFLSDGPVRIDMTHHERLIVTGPDQQQPPPQVRGFSGPGAIPTLNFLAYVDSMTGGVRVAVGDVNGDKTEDFITGPGAGFQGHVKVFDGATLRELRSFLPYGADFTGGVFVAAGDVNGDGAAEIITGAGAGAGPHVKVFDGPSGNELASFFAYGASFAGGVHVAAGDVNGDGFAEIITGAGAIATHVKAFDGRSLHEIRSFFAYPGFAGGVFVAAGDVNGDGRADIITGAGAGAGPHVKVFDGHTSAELASFFAYTPGSAGGVRVAAGDIDGDGRCDIITGAGPGAAPHVKALSGATFGEIATFFAYPAVFQGGIFVGGAAPSTRLLPSADLDGDGLLDTWERTFYGNLTAVDADDDSDGDGLTSLEELGFKLNPRVPDRADAPAVVVEDGYLTVTVAKQLGAAYQGQSAGGELGLGGPDTFSADSTTILINDATTLKVRDNIRLRESPTRFLRVQVTGAP